MTWPTKKLGEAVYFQEGPGLRTFQFKSAGIRVINVANVREGFLDLLKTKFLDPAEVKQKYKHFLVNDNDILVSTSGTIGRVGWVTKKDLPLMLNTSVVRFHTLNENILLNKFLFYFLCSNIFKNELLKYKTGVAIFNVGPSHIKKIKIPLPPLKVQKQIVERLDKIAEAQKLNDKLIQKSDELFQSLLHKEINSTDKNWGVKKLGEVASINYGKGLPKSEKIESGQYFAYGSNGPIYKTNKILANKPIVVVGRKGAAGALYLVNEPSWPIDTTFYLETDGVNVDLNFLFYSLQTKNLPRLAIVTAVPGINRENLKKVNIAIPPIKIQKQIVAKLSAAQEYKKQLLEQKLKLKELFDSVLDKSMKGGMNR